MSDTESHAYVYQQLEDRYGRLDVLCANAGIGLRQGLRETSLDQWNRVMAINLTGHYFMVKRILPLMRSGSSIVLMSSIAALRPRIGHSAYGASKAALCSLSRSLGAELIAEGIRVNSVCPGPIDTAMIASIVQGDDAAHLEFRNAVATSNPMKRFGTPEEEEVAAAVLFLASDEASSPV